jgi:hypothetical protein
MQFKRKSLTTLALVSSVAFSSACMASDIEQPDSVKIKFTAPIQSAVAKYFLADGKAAIESFETFLRQREERLEESKRQLEERNDLMGQAREGSLFALRKLAYNAETSGESLQWLYTEMLMSFGESFDFPSMLYHAKQLEEGAAQFALDCAGTWLHGKFYGDIHMSLLQPHALDFATAFDSYFAEGDFADFFKCTDKIKKEMARVEYLNTFRLLGVDVVNPLMAYNQLHAAKRANHKPARELVAVLDLLEKPHDPALKTLTIKELMGTKRPIIQTVLDCLWGVDYISIPKYDSQPEIMDALRATLKLDN